MLLPDLTRSATIIVRTGFNKRILILTVQKAKHQIKILVLLKVTMTQTQERFPLQQVCISLSTKGKVGSNSVRENIHHRDTTREFTILWRYCCSSVSLIVGRVLYKLHYLNVRDKTVWASFAKERFISTEQTPISGLDPETTCDCSE